MEPKFSLNVATLLYLIVGVWEWEWVQGSLSLPSKTGGAAIKMGWIGVRWLLKNYFWVVSTLAPRHVRHFFVRLFIVIYNLLLNKFSNQWVWVKRRHSFPRFAKWLSCKTLTVSHVFNSMSIKSSKLLKCGKGESLLNGIEGDYFEKSTIRPSRYRSPPVILPFLLNLSFKNNSCPINITSVSVCISPKMVLLPSPSFILL